MKKLNPHLCSLPKADILLTGLPSNSGVVFFMGVSKERKRLHKLYGHLYTRLGGVDWEKCIYCDSQKQHWDHVPPLKITDSINIKRFKKNGGAFRLYPACAQCNKLLGSYSSSNFYDRIDFLIKKYEVRFKKIEFWDEYELEDLGYNLRKHIENNQSDFSTLNNKLTNLVEKFCSDDYLHLI